MTQTREAAADACEAFVPERNHYYAGKVLSARDFQAEQQYFNHKRWMLNRHLFGWGVVCGLHVDWDGRRLVIHPGLALDCCGRELMVPVRERVRIDERYRGPGARRLVVCLEYRECHTEPVRDPLDPRCHGTDRTRYNRVRDSYEITVRPWDDVCTATPERPCYLDRVQAEPSAAGGAPVREVVREGAGDEGGDGGGDGGGADDTAGGGRRPTCPSLGLREYVCGEIRERCPRCSRHACVVLATLQVTYPPFPEQGEGADDGDARQAAGLPAPRVDAGPDPCRELDPRVRVYVCRPGHTDAPGAPERRLVYSNPLLYDLIECFHGDPPRIVALGWKNVATKARRMEWGSFVELLLEESLSVTFDRPMENETINAHTFQVAVRITDEETGAWIWTHVPCARIDPGVGSPPTGCHQAVFIPEQGWVADELIGRKSGIAGGIDVEITLRGSLIMGENGRALDGDYIGSRLPTGNGTQGGDFVDWFTVGARENGYVYRPKTGAAGAEMIDGF